MREDCDQLTSHPVWSTKIAQWMITAARVATGGRRRVLEDGPDVMNSDDEDAKKEEHGEELTGMYGQGCTSLDQARMSEQQAQMQRAAASFTSSLALFSSEPERKATPLASPVNSDDEGMSEDQRSCSNRGKKMAKRSAKSSAALLSRPPRLATRIPLPTDSDPEIQAPAKAPPLEITKTTKAAASQRASADQSTEAKASTRKKGQVKGQESPGTQVPPPMQTRARAGSGAGGFRGVDGSGQTGYVCGKSSPSSKPGS
jgi:hypothetical protein